MHGWAIASWNGPILMGTSASYARQTFKDSVGVSILALSVGTITTRSELNIAAVGVDLCTILIELSLGGINWAARK